MLYENADYEDAEESDRQSGEAHSKDELLRKFSEWDSDVMGAQSQWATEARLCYDMVAGDQWDKDAIEQLKLQEIAPITWNRVQPLVDAVSGAQIQNRHEIRFFPREVGDASVAEVLTAAAEWVADEGDFADEETDAFFDTLVCGLGWTETRMCYEEEPDGEIKKDRVDPLEMRWDPAARKRNLADMTFLRRRRPFSKSQFRARFPEWADEITEGDDDQDQTNHTSENPGDDYPETDNDEPEKRHTEIYVKEYQWYEIETYKRVYDEMTGEQAELSEEDYDRLKERLDRMGLGFRLDAVTLKRRVYYRAFCADDKILDYERMPTDGFTYHAITGKRDRNKGTWYGLVRAMVDPQRWANKWMTQILVILNKNAKGGILAETDAFDDPKQAEEEWARPDSIAWLKPGAVAQGKIQNKPQPQYPQGMERMIQMAIASIKDVTGVNQELLGMVDRDQPGILEAQRKEAGYAMLSMFFDSLRRYRKMSGRTLLTFIQRYMSPETVIRVVGQDGATKYVALGMQSENTRYDIIVDEAPSGPNQKDKVWAMFVQLMPLLTRTPVPPQIWAEMVKWSPLPQSVSQTIQQHIMQAAQPNPQAMQAMQERQAMEKAAFQAEIAKTQADAMSKQADAQAKMARLPIEQAGLMVDAAKVKVDHEKVRGDLAIASMEAQEAQIGLTRSAAEVEGIKAKTALTEAQRANQLVETAIAQLYALQQQITGRTDIRVVT